MPATVLAAQVANGAYPDPYYARNLRDIPGTDYPVGHIFAKLPMSANSPYACPWWYRTRFTLPANAQGRTLWLRFAGINYRANIWINGQRLADADTVAGAYRTYEFDVTRLLRPGRQNAIAIETFAPTEHDLGINWVDWNPAPPDKNMGLPGEVTLSSSGAVRVRSPMVVTHLPQASPDLAELTLYGELHNASALPVEGIATVSLLSMRLDQPVTLAPGESRTVAFTPAQYPRLRVRHPRLWWPYQMGQPHLETLRMSFSITTQEATHISDASSVRFGMREITTELTATGARLFRVNGHPILVRGAGWAEDMLLREDPERLRQQFEMVRDLHLNTLRLEGKLETEAFYRLADEQGILVMAGWACCDQWEQWSQWSAENNTVAAASLRAQMLRLRSHASLLVWLNGSDNPPPSKVEQMYLDIERETHWPNPTLSSASAHTASISGASGVKMSGPYDYVAPSYWLTDPGKRGGAFGFNTETSPGPAIPVESSLRRFLPATKLWPPNDDWQYHNGGGAFAHTTLFDEAMRQSYGTPHSLPEYERAAQAMAYDGERAMFEAYGRNKYTATGVVQWMLNNAWPSMIWHLYDYYLDAGGGYYGARKACEPLHVQYSYDDRSVVVVNSSLAPSAGLRVRAAVYDLGARPMYSQEASVHAVPDSSMRVFSIPTEALTKGGGLHFVKLTLTNPAGQRVSDNFYWIPAKLTEFDWARSNYRYTPARRYADLTALAQLPRAQIDIGVIGASGDGPITLRLRNLSDTLAFQVVLRALDVQGAPIAPAFWSDNYLSLLPGESTTLTVRPSIYGGTRIANVEMTGWNVESRRLHLPAPR